MPYWWHEAKDCCDLIAATCIRWDPDTEDPTHACLWHWEFKPGCIYNAKQYDEVCPLGPGKIECRGGVLGGSHECKDKRFHPKCCDATGEILDEYEELRSNFLEMCKKLKNQKWCPSLKKGIRECLSRWCNAEDRSCNGGEAQIICERALEEGEEGSLGWTDPLANCSVHLRGNAGIPEIFHELIHSKWCNKPRKEVEACVRNMARKMKEKYDRREAGTYPCQALCFGDDSLPREYKYFAKYKSCCT